MQEISLWFWIPWEWRGVIDCGWITFVSGPSTSLLRIWFRIFKITLLICIMIKGCYNDVICFSKFVFEFESLRRADGDHIVILSMAANGIWHNATIPQMQTLLQEIPKLLEALVNLSFCHHLHCNCLIDNLKHNCLPG